VTGGDGTMATRDVGPATEVAVSADMVKRGLIVAPVIIAVCLVIWGFDGALSSAYGIVIVLANFALAARLISSTAPISLGLMMGAILFGYLLRLGLIFGAVWIVRDAAWISFRPSERPSSSRTSGCWSGNSSTWRSRSRIPD
jgi:hypothetical protein